MIEERQFRAKITVKFYQREDGGLRAECEDINGFYLSSADREALIEDIIPVLEQLLHSNYGLDVDVHPLAPARYLLVERSKEVPENQTDYREYTYDHRQSAA